MFTLIKCMLGFYPDYHTMYVTHMLSLYTACLLKYNTDELAKPFFNSEEPLKYFSGLKEPLQKMTIFSLRHSVMLLGIRHVKFVSGKFIKMKSLI